MIFYDFGKILKIIKLQKTGEKFIDLNQKTAVNE
jgi:hypothetical protein